MGAKVSINGFGRIGRNIYRASFASSEIRELTEFVSAIEKVDLRVKLAKNRIRQLLRLLRIMQCVYLLILMEFDFFRLHGFGRPPHSLSRALFAGLFQMIGRICVSPALA